MIAREVSGKSRSRLAGRLPAALQGGPRRILHRPSFGFDKPECRVLLARPGVGRFPAGPASPPRTTTHTMSDLLEPEEIKTKLKKIPEWDLDGKRLVRTMEFDGFEEAVDFVNEVAEIAEKHGHHPDIDIRYNKVILSLTTHSAGGLTEDDFTVAAVIDNAVD